jgi:hypothetical protein
MYAYPAPILGVHRVVIVRAAFYQSTVFRGISNGVRRQKGRGFRIGILRAI